MSSNYLYVTLVRAKFFKKGTNTSSKPFDAYCQLKCEDVKYKSSVFHQTSEPTWNEKFRFPIKTMSVLKIKIYRYLCDKPSVCIHSLKLELNKIEKNQKEISFKFDKEQNLVQNGIIYFKFSERSLKFEKKGLERRKTFISFLRRCEREEERGVVLSSLEKRRALLDIIFDEYKPSKYSSKRNIQKKTRSNNKESEQLQSTRGVVNKRSETVEKERNSKVNQQSDKKVKLGIKPQNQNNNNNNNNGDYRGLETLNSLKNNPIHFVFGYNTWESRDNLFLTSEGLLFYYTGCLGIIYDEATKKQKLFTAHKKNIICNAITKDRRIAATASSDGCIYIWDLETCSVINYLVLEGGVSILSMAFYLDERLVMVASNKEFTIYVYNIKSASTTQVNSNNSNELYKPELIAKKGGHKNKILRVAFYHDNPNKFVTCGIRSFTFHEISSDSQIIESSGSFGQHKPVTFLSLFLNNSNETIACSNDGNAYIWSLATKKILHKIRISSGPCNTIKNDDYSNQDTKFICGSKDSNITVWDMKSYENLNTFPTLLGGSIKSVDLYNEKIVAGTIKNQIWASNTGSKSSTQIVFNHSDQIHGLSTHPTKLMFITASDDRSVFLWSPVEKRILKKKKLNGQPRKVQFSPNGDIIGVGMKDGTISLLRTLDLSKLAYKKEHNSQPVAITFSKDGQYFAISFQDSMIDVYLYKSLLKKIGKIKTIKPIENFDFSKDSKFIRWIENNKMVCWCIGDTFKSKKNPQEMNWASENCDVAINFVSGRSIDFYNQKMLCCQDTEILVYDSKFDNPRILSGHGSQISEARFLQDQFIISVGGLDQSIFCWKI
ncbi:wd-40 repeat protein [Anaeramoeba flamelloides]|uniref:Wd-40 repeat protein n=1 Tax=Anaeramoeba flamelloides TaxID=1746091 RepID=A0AAV7Z093_9EUKA|nr:wd-40 repeat protein [Anaeramoeba flamelloides]